MTESESFGFAGGCGALRMTPTSTRAPFVRFATPHSEPRHVTRADEEPAPATEHDMPHALSIALAPGDAQEAVHDRTLPVDGAVSESPTWYLPCHALVTVSVADTPFDDALDVPPTAGCDGCGCEGWLGCGAGG